MTNISLQTVRDYLESICLKGGCLLHTLQLAAAGWEERERRGEKKNQWESTIPYNMKMQPFLFYTFQIHFEKFSSRAHAVVAARVVVQGLSQTLWHVVACRQPCMYHLITERHSYTSGPSHTGRGNYNACIIMHLEIILWSLRSSNTRFHADFPQLESCQVSAHVSAVNTYPLPQIDTSLQFYIFSAFVQLIHKAELKVR